MSHLASLNPKTEASPTPSYKLAAQKMHAKSNKLFWVTLAVLLVVAADPLLALPTPFIEKYCYDCHDVSSAKGGLDLEALNLADKRSEATSAGWERVLKRVRAGEMPPPERKSQPTGEERAKAVAALHQSLLEHSAPGGVMRRLNRSEYENTIESLLGIDFEVPDEFPPDTVQHGFDNSAAGLLLSPALMEAYFDAATLAADELFPPDSRPVSPERFEVGPKEFTFAETGGRVVGDVIRMVVRTARISDSCIWPAKFETRIPGQYKLRVTASRFAPGSVANPEFNGPMKLRVYAQPIDNDEGKSIGTMRKLAELEVDSNDPETIECVVELARTEAPVLYFANALISRPTDRPPADHLKTPSFEGLIREMLTRDKRLFAVWQDAEIGGGLQRGSAWANLKRLRDAPGLDLEAIDHSPEKIEEVVQRLKKGIGFVDPVFTYQLFEEGPALQVHSMEIIGPLEVRVEEKERKRRGKLVPRFMAAAPAEAAPEAKVRPIMEWFLSKAFRRPVPEADVARFSAMVHDHMKAGHRLEEGLHLAIRAALISPRFLYRGHQVGELDDWDLSVRLAYFLTGAPPDDQLVAAAAAGVLSEPGRLAEEASRLIDSEEIRRFVKNFAGQWLGLRNLEDITPDPRLIVWQNGHREGMIGEAERFFTEVLQTNRSLRTFIKPEFTWGNERLLNEIYGQKVKIPDWGFARIEIPEGATFGGLLGQAGVLMATSNGTQTQPVARGVWVLRNILGDPPSPPPPGTPAIEPDTRGARTVRELMAAHATDTKCASCHRKIDPIGIALENYGPLGRWRTHYPRWAKDEEGKPVRENGLAIDPRSEFPGGVVFENASDLRAYVLKNIDRFGTCLSEKLMTYAMGRRPNYAERAEIEHIVQAHLQDPEAGFRDLLLDLIRSKAFGMR